MRMCETDRGTWILGSHEGDWSYKPLITRQYLLRSEDQGESWEVIPGRRHGGGWHAIPLPTWRLARHSPGPGWTKGGLWP